MRIAANIKEIIGRTPIVKLDKISANTNAIIAGKLELMNPFGSINDRIVFSAIKNAEKDAMLRKDSIIVVPSLFEQAVIINNLTSSSGYKSIFVIPQRNYHDNCEKYKSYNLEIIVAKGGLHEAKKTAIEITKKEKNKYLLDQLINSDKSWKESIADEIWKDTDGLIDMIVCCTETITGIAESIKIKRPKLISVAVEQKEPFVTENRRSFFSTLSEHEKYGNVENVMKISKKNAQETARKLAVLEGINAGMFSGAAVYAAEEAAQNDENRGKLIIAVLPDSGSV